MASLVCFRNLRIRLSPVQLVAIGLLVSTGIGAQPQFIQGRSAIDSVPSQSASSSVITNSVPGQPASSSVITNRLRGDGAQPGPIGKAGPNERPGGELGAGGTSERLQRSLTVESPKDRIEFQDFVFQATGKDLPIFGAELFRDSPSTFAPLENVPVTSGYALGPGDEIVIRAWGQVDIEYAGVVDRNGTITIPKVGVLNVAGIKYEDLTSFLRASIGRTFRNFELTATLGKLRSMQIFVVGHAKRPGTYTVSSLSTLVTALFSAGGPSAVGSMRSIQLKRGSKVVVEFDLYDLLVSGDKSKDMQLLPGDVIYIPPIGKLAAISGSVNVPAIYELKPAASLAELVRWAGGLSTTAEGQKITLERIVDQRVRKVEEFPLDGLGLSHAVRDGDLVTVYALLPRFDNAITLRGNVGQPGRFPWRAGMRVRDLIPDKESLISRGYSLKRDRLPGVNPTVDSLPLLNQIKPLLSEINWEYAVIERIRKDDLRSTLIPFNLGKAVLEGDEQQNLTLQPGDVITIFSSEDIQLSSEKQTRFIRLEGEFRSSGIYQVMPGETLRQLVARVGGLAPNAYLFGAQLTRESTRIHQQKNLDDALNRLEQDLQRSAAARAQSAITSEDTGALKEQAESQRALVAKLRALRPTGRIVLGLTDASTLKDLPDLPLEDGDRFFVPSPPSMVSVFGAVFNENAYIYSADRRVADYLAQAGGFTRGADEGGVYVIRADGSVVSKRQSGYFASGGFSGLRLMPGDSIVVPEEFDKTSFMRNLKDIAQIFYQVGLGAAAIKVLRQ